MSAKPTLAVGHIPEKQLSLHILEPDGATTGDPVIVDLSGVPGGPHEVAYDPGRRRLYVAHTYVNGWYLSHEARDHRISVVDIDNAAVAEVFDIGADATAARAPHDLWFDTARDRLWVAVEADDASRSGALIAVDPGTGAQIARIDADARAAHWFATSPDGSRAYTANKETPYVSVLDLETERLVARVEVPGGAEGITVGGDGRAFVAGPCRLPGSPVTEPVGVRVIDCGSDEVVDLIEMAHAPGAVHVTSSGLLLAAELRVATGLGDPVAGMLKIWSATTLEPLGEVPVGATILTIRSSADGKLAFVADCAGGLVTVVDLSTLRVVSTIKDVTGAHGLAIIPPA
ncbi:YncE family protein [Amycolatopsis ultiminotia]|uniref:YncE family protein n=1 Tax=Amycolatopsis ultiminotia TaxID=543629 RepID=A0ABP6V527_9PSEU